MAVPSDAQWYRRAFRAVAGRRSGVALEFVLVETLAYVHVKSYDTCLSHVTNLTIEVHGMYLFVCQLRFHVFDDEIPLFLAAQ